jgi:hypothetical protein
MSQGWGAPRPAAATTLFLVLAAIHSAISASQNPRPASTSARAATTAERLPAFRDIASSAGIDFVHINGEEGTVVNLGMFTTRIRTGLGHEVTLPNGVVMSSVTRNFPRTGVANQTLVDTGVTIGYDVPWREVQAMLLEAARRTTGVLVEPRPWVAQTALSDFYIEYRLLARMDAARPESRRADHSVDSSWSATRTRSSRTPGSSPAPAASAAAITDRTRSMSACCIFTTPSCAWRKCS